MGENKYILRWGDPHITTSSLEDGEKIVQFILQIMENNKVDSIDIVGDLFDNHAVKRIEVEYFWLNTINSLNGVPINILLGNHDMILGRGKHSGKNSLHIFKHIKNVNIIETPNIINNIGYIPYLADNKTFINVAKEFYNSGAKQTIVCHQTIDGAKFDNGFYAPDGINLNDILQPQIISGHIHNKCVFGDNDKCLYVGSSRWNSISDANQDKGIYIFEHSSNGALINYNFYSLRNIIKPINKIILTEGEADPALDPNALNYLELYGQSTWIKKMKKKYEKLARISSKPTDRRAIKAVKSNLTIDSFLLNDFKPIPEVTKEDILKYLKKGEDERSKI